MANTDFDPLDFMDDGDECWRCGGDGGWASCMEDCCPAIGGEDECDGHRTARRRRVTVLMFGIVVACSWIAEQTLARV